MLQRCSTSTGRPLAAPNWGEILIRIAPSGESGAQKIEIVVGPPVGVDMNKVMKTVEVLDRVSPACPSCSWKASFRLWLGFRKESGTMSGSARTAQRSLISSAGAFSARMRSQIFSSSIRLMTARPWLPRTRPIAASISRATPSIESELAMRV